MTPEKQRIAIASAMPNWTVHHGGKYCAITNCPDGPLRGRLFDPLNDRNAMSSALLTLPPDQREQFVYELLDVLGISTEEPVTPEEMFIALTAEPGKQVRAFLRTIGKWEDE